MEPPALDAAPRASEVGRDFTVVAMVLAGACTFINVYCTQPLLPILSRTYKASAAAVSLTVSATTFGVALAAPLVGLVAESIGRKRVIVPALFGLSLPTLLAATSTSLQMLIFWRFVQGLFVPGIIAVMMAYINEEWEGRGTGLAMSAYVSGTVLGGFSGRFITGFVTTYWHWRMTFVVLGVVNLIGAVGVRRWLPKARRFIPAHHLKASIGDALRHLRNPRLLANFGMGFTVLFGLAATFTYVNFYLAAPPYRLDAAQLGSVFLVYLLGVLVTPMAGRYLDRHGFRKTAALALSVSLAGLALTLAHSLWLIIAGLALFSSGIFITQASATVQTGTVAGRARSSAAGLYITFYYLGGSFGATIPAWFWARGGWLWVVAVIALASCGSFAFARWSAK